MNMLLNQAIALVAGKKTKSEKLLTTIHHGWKPERLSGITRTYQPKQDDGDTLPPESRAVQLKVKDTLPSLIKELKNFLNLVATQERANTEAKANIKVNGTTLLSDVPVTVLLFLEKQLIKYRCLAILLPVLPTDRTWKHDQTKNCFVTEPEETTRTQKIPKPLILHKATEQHPAQVQLVHEDKIVGYWTTIHLSGAMTVKERDDIIERIETLQDAVKMAREKANSIEIKEEKDFGKKVLDYIFTSK